MVSRTITGKSSWAVVVISPAIMARPVVTRVSQATRANLSWAMMASKIASEIWSATLSGCPSVTDSEVKRNSDLAILHGLLYKNNRSAGYFPRLSAYLAKFNLTLRKKREVFQPRRYF